MGRSRRDRITASMNAMLVFADTMAALKNSVSRPTNHGLYPDNNGKDPSWVKPTN